MTFCAVQSKPNLLQLPCNSFDPIMDRQTYDWEFLEIVLDVLGVSVTGDIFSLQSKASLSAADSMATEALFYANSNKFKQRHCQGLSGPLEFAGLYAGIAAKYAYFCSLRKAQAVLKHFATQSWEPLHAALLVPAQPAGSESWSEGLDFAKTAWAIMQEEPKVLTYGATA